MSMSDTLADMLTRIRNGQKSKLVSVMVPYSRTKCDILSVLRDEGYISDYRVEDVRSGIKSIEVDLKYSSNGTPAITQINRVSKPGKRIYVAVGDMKEHFNGMGILIVSTSAGVVSDRAAYKAGIGGEVICKVF